jgi:DNA-binding response OmpR family regulator
VVSTPVVSTANGQLEDADISETLEFAANRSFVRGKHFVVVEDDVLVADALRKTLEMMGGEVTCFANAEHALQHPNIGNADCYIVDYMLPGEVDGISFLLGLREQQHKPVCAVMMSGNTSSSFIRQTERFDWPVLHKPVNISKLIARLDEQYGRDA